MGQENENDQPAALRFFFQLAKVLVSATEWLQLIVGSSFAVILVEKNFTTLPWGRGRVGSQS